MAPAVVQKEKGVPLAYLRYIVYDADSNYVESGYQPLTRQAQGSWEQLELIYVAGQDGYAEVYVANESMEETWMDDMSIMVSTPMLVQENHYDPWGLNLVGIEQEGSPDHKFQYNGKEKQTELGLNWLDYGARMYDAQIGRWLKQDNLAEKYERISPYVYALNDPLNAIDPEGNLVIFVNGFMPDMWAKHTVNKLISNLSLGGLIKVNSQYPPSREFMASEPNKYWGNVDDAFIQGYASMQGFDENALYVNASSGNTSEASDRFSEGRAAAANLISQLEAGGITLGEGEKIKIVSHSQGGAFAAGMASVLSKNDKYKSILQEVVYLEPHQPARFSHPQSIFGWQVSSEKDRVASKWNLFSFLKGKTSFTQIEGGCRAFQLNNTYDGDPMKGHSVGTNLDEIIRFFRSRGVNVNVSE